MYTFLIEQDLQAYDTFLADHHGQYIQSSFWKDVKTTWKCTYYSGFCKDERVLIALVMERTLPLVGKIWYVSNGMLCDYHDEALLTAFTDFINTKMKQEKITSLIIDPSISLRINHQLREDGIVIHHTLTRLGYRLNTNIKNYTYKQPVQLFIPLTKDNQTLSKEELLKKCDKGVRYSLRIAAQRGLVSESYDYQQIIEHPEAMEDFMGVMKDTSSRDDFVSRNGDYCTNILKSFNKTSDLKLVYYDKSLDTQLEMDRQAEKKQLTESLQTASSKKIKSINEAILSIDKQSEQYQKRIQEVEAFTSQNRICVAGGLTIYYAKMGSCLFGGTRNVIRNNTRSSHYLNYLRLCESLERGCEVHDLGYVIVQNPELQKDGILGPLVAYDHFKGIYDFKKSFGSDYHEFIGEYVLVNNPFKHFIYAVAMPTAKKLKVNLFKHLKK
ncbi:MAG: peptidoglycan bridge formation glycyltransferase FemA/FemB family protein [Erysipelotrichaceae bacterium]